MKVTIAENKRAYGDVNITFHRNLQDTLIEFWSAVSNLTPQSTVYFHIPELNFSSKSNNYQHNHLECKKILNCLTLLSAILLINFANIVIVHNRKSKTFAELLLDSVKDDRIVLIDV